MLIKDLFQQKIAENLIEHDPFQAEAVEALNEIQRTLESAEQSGVSSRKPKPSFLARWFDKTPTDVSASVVKGVYLWGGVGRGKTWLMDQFYKSIAITQKRRYHFNRFMLDLHQALKEHPEQEDPLEVIAKELAKDLQLLCLDEVHLTEIANAMLLYPILEHLIQSGVVLVTTSNRHPDELYQGKIQAERFIEPGEFLKAHLHIMHLDNGSDYRVRRTELTFGENPEIFARNAASMQQCFQKLGQGDWHTDYWLPIHGRNVRVRQSNDNVIWFDFVEICETSRTTSDYIWLTEHYDVVMISNVPVMTADRDPAARRFFYLVDELYDSKVRFIFSAESSLDQLYQGHRLQFGFKRTLSRLLAMHTANRLSC